MVWGMDFELVNSLILVLREKRMHVPEMPDAAVLLTVDKNYRTSGDYYESARYAWRANKERLESADYIFAVTDEVIREVFVADRWYYVQNGRCAFDGEVADQGARDLYVDMPVPDRLRRRRGARNPVRYENC